MLKELYALFEALHELKQVVTEDEKHGDDRTEAHRDFSQRVDKAVAKVENVLGA
jgi:hypothetical protein